MADVIDLDAELRHETDRAYLLDFGGAEAIWLPKSQVEFDDTDNTVTLPEWLAIEKGLI